MNRYLEKFTARLGEFDDHRFQQLLKASGSGQLKLMDPLDLWNYRFFSYIRDTLVTGENPEQAITSKLQNLTWAIHYGELLTMLKGVDELVETIETKSPDVPVNGFEHDPDGALKRIDDFMETLLPLIELADREELLMLSEDIFQHYLSDYRAAGRPPRQERPLEKLRKLCNALWKTPTKEAVDAFLEALEAEPFEDDSSEVLEESKKRLRALSLELMVEELWKRSTDS